MSQAIVGGQAGEAEKKAGHGNRRIAHPPWNALPLLPHRLCRGVVSGRMRRGGKAGLIAERADVEQIRRPQSHKGDRRDRGELNQQPAPRRGSRQGKQRDRRDRQQA